jgi:hypothetical protein
MYLSCDSSFRRGFDRGKGEYMFQHVNKNGISFDQAKKDAKKLSKSENIPLNQALDRIAFQHARSTWAQAVEQSKARIIYTLPNIGRVALNDRASFTEIRGLSGSGKTIFMYDVMEQFLKQGIVVNLITRGSGIPFDGSQFIPPTGYGADPCPNTVLNDLRSRYGLLINIIDVEETIDLSSFTLSRGVLFVDEIYLLRDFLRRAANRHPDIVSPNPQKQSHPVRMLESIMQVSKHTFISKTGLAGSDDISFWNPNRAEHNYVQFYTHFNDYSGTNANAVKWGQHWLEFDDIKKLETVRGEYSEFYFSSPAVKPKKVRFYHKYSEQHAISS